ncbi:MAG: hypothetical protein WCS98_04895 [Bacillota bacterium]|nr:hypothetical protein [Bacillota bacterium]MDD3298417.1 hypothetical protein [Bacillota bacterium]MDD3850605.1 hypothetical protein [Bacillota bacterium]MDD4707413.1 hypothetical protein [Bacillota bacterium]
MGKAGIADAGFFYGKLVFGELCKAIALAEEDTMADRRDNNDYLRGSRLRRR